MSSLGFFGYDDIQAIVNIFLKNEVKAFLSSFVLFRSQHGKYKDMGK